MASATAAQISWTGGFQRASRFDPSTPFGERVRRRLRDVVVVWLNTVGADGTPQPNPV